jgi:hypothetical protein
MERKLIILLQDLLAHVDEDCPSEYRTKHLRMCMDEVRETIKDYKERN